MYLSEFVGLLKRRWWMVGVGVVVVGAGVGATIALTAPTYESSGRVLLLPPTTRLQPDERVNPYLALPDGLTLTAALLAADVSGLDTQRDLEVRGLGGTYSASVMPGQGPVVSVVIDGAEGAAVVRQRDYLVELVSRRLEELQDAEGVVDAQRISARDITADSAATSSRSNAIKLAMLVGLLGFSLLAATVLGVDRRGARRAASRGRSTEGGDRSIVGAARPAPFGPTLATTAAVAVEPSVASPGHDGGQDGLDVAVALAGLRVTSTAVHTMRVDLGPPLEPPTHHVVGTSERSGAMATISPSRALDRRRAHVEGLLEPITKGRRQVGPVIDGLSALVARARRSSVLRQPRRLPRD